MYSCGCSKVIKKLFNGSGLDENTINLIQLTIESQIDSGINEKILLGISEFLEKVPEDNFHIFESSVITSTGEKISCVQIDTLIHELTYGGKISASNKIKLEKFIKDWFLSSTIFKNRYFPNVFVETKYLSNGYFTEEKISVPGYTKDDIIYLIVLVWKFIMTIQAEVVY
ncbi:hypothetical protein [Saudi moumouvirus]|nr:hypothetical protein [Saudi moumouvirus]